MPSPAREEDSWILNFRAALATLRLDTGQSARAHRLNLSDYYVLYSCWEQGAAFEISAGSPVAEKLVAAGLLLMSPPLRRDRSRATLTTAGAQLVTVLPPRPKPSEPPTSLGMNYELHQW